MPFPMPSLSFQSSQSASSEAKGQIGELGQTTTAGGDAGNRGFMNNVAFPGSTLNADQGNGAALDLKSLAMVGGLLLVAIVGLVIIFRHHGHH